MDIIEKSYKYEVPSANEFYGIFKEKYSRRTLPSSWDNNPEWTKVILDIFKDMGKSLGYKPKTGYLDLDMTRSIRHEETSVISVAIEHENGDLRDVIDDELQKLVDTKAYLKVLMFYPGTPFVSEKETMLTEISEKISSARITVPQEEYLIITPILRTDKNKNPVSIGVFACSLDQAGKWKELPSFDVPYPKK
jgi:hypothetical protein